MKREAMNQLLEWKNKINRKPLIIEGARQVGKTWIMQEFGKTAYDKTIYINFDSNVQMNMLFNSDYNIERILLGLEIYSGQKIVPQSTLLIFDEVQEAPKALSSLKYFYENAPEYHIICAGSLLGLALHNGTSFPVGKVEFMKLSPLSFREFLLALSLDSYVSLLDSHDFHMIHTFSLSFIDALKQYYFVGGMPEAVLHFSLYKDTVEVRNIQSRILSAYEQDFSKHAPYDVVPRIRMLWQSIPSQLAKENKKFIYGLIRDGARAKEYEAALLWLSDCGLIHKVHRVNTPHIPLKAYQDLKAFKIYLLDIGLLGCMAGLRANTILDGNALFTEFKGALTEQFVLQQLIANSTISLYYYTNDRGSAEVDFVIDNGEDILPVEVKAETNLKAKSLRYYNEKYQPSTCIRLSMSEYKKENWLVNIPLYAVSELVDISTNVIT